jgi:tetratricopeptide (TPR) repeat protein
MGDRINSGVEGDSRTVKLCSLRWTALVLALSGVAVRADEPRWLRFTTPNFELLTTAGERSGRDAIQYFEQVHGFFLQVTGSRKTWSAPVRIIGFRSAKEFQPYRPSEAAAAFYLPGPSCDYIVMGGIGSDFYPGAVHEYVHLRVKHTGLKVPLWLNEGMADLYSTLKPLGGKIQIGAVDAGRYQLLQEKKWLPLEVLTTAGHDSAHYNEKDRAGVFYTESWALTHMLMLSNDYRPKFAEIVSALAAEKSADESLQQVYGKRLWEVERELRTYMRGDRFNAAIFDAKLAKPTEKPEMRPAAPLEVGLMLADILAQTRGKEAAAREAYQKLLASNPQSWEAEEGLAYLAWRMQEMDEARRRMARAVDLGSTNAKMYYEYALLGPAGGKDQARAALLRKAVELKPDHRDARFHLGQTLVGLGEYKEAREQLLALKQVTPEQAPHYFRALAYVNLRLGLKDEARKAAEGARKFAKTPEDTAFAENLLQHMDSVEAAQERLAASQKPDDEPGPSLEPAARKPAGEERDEVPRNLTLKRREPAGDTGGQVHEVRRTAELFPAEGSLVQVDCLGAVARVWLQTGDDKVAFAITDPGKVVILRGGKNIEHEFTCGPQKPQPVAVRYEMKPNARLDTLGVLRELEFK